jgi:hypothetical protein
VDDINSFSYRIFDVSAWVVDGYSEVWQRNLEEKFERIEDKTKKVEINVKTNGEKEGTQEKGKRNRS